MYFLVCKLASIQDTSARCGEIVRKDRQNVSSRAWFRPMSVYRIRTAEKRFRIQRQELCCACLANAWNMADSAQCFLEVSQAPRGFYAGRSVERHACRQ